MKLEVFSDLSERLIYNLPGFPLYARNGELRNYERYAAACHWHPDMEFILILGGSMDYFVNGKTFHINTGEGIFVNSKRLHYGFSYNSSDCSFIVVAVHPSLIGGYTNIGKAYLESKYGFETEDCILLTKNIGWQAEVLQSIKLIYDEMYSNMRNPLRLISQITALCANIGDNIGSCAANHTDEHLWPVVWNMTGFIQKNYDQKISLDDIAAAGSICRSRCCRLFNQYIGQSPGVYLTLYRINKSCDMLRETNMSILEVSMACGFQSPSYFTHIFHKMIGFTPKHYRNQCH